MGPEPTPADKSDQNNKDKGRAIAAIAAGFIVFVLTGIVASSFVLAATWSSIHGGMSQIMLAVLSLAALAVPLGCGFLVGRAMYGSLSRRAIPMDSSRGLPLDHKAEGATANAKNATANSVRLNCPHCGCSLESSTKYPATPAHIVVECPIHGPLHFGPHTEITLGVPPRT